MDGSPDCLVLKLEEYDPEVKQIDTTIYILYDVKEDKYVIRGQRQVTPQYKSCAYSFDCDDPDDLVDFLKIIFCSKNLIHETLYNYDNLPKYSNEITFEFLKDHSHRDYELSGYDMRKIKRSRLLTYFKILRNVFNYYI